MRVAASKCSSKETMCVHDLLCCSSNLHNGIVSYLNSNQHRIQNVPSISSYSTLLDQVLIVIYTPSATRQLEQAEHQDICAHCSKKPRGVGIIFVLQGVLSKRMDRALTVNARTVPVLVIRYRCRSCVLKVGKPPTYKESKCGTVQCSAFHLDVGTL